MRGSFFGPPSEEGASHLGRFGNLRIFQATVQPPVPVALTSDTIPAAPVVVGELTVQQQDTLRVSFRCHPKHHPRNKPIPIPTPFPRISCCRS